MYFQTGKSLIFSNSKIKSYGQTGIKEFMTHFSAQLTQCTTLRKRPDDRVIKYFALQLNVRCYQAKCHVFKAHFATFQNKLKNMSNLPQT